MSRELRKTLNHLIANNFTTRFAETDEDACRIILDMLSETDVVGIGDSATIRQIGLLKQLHRTGMMILNPFSRQLATVAGKRVTLYEMARDIFTSNMFITGANVVTSDGKIVNMDAVGNRVAAMIFGPERVIIVVGRNKIVENVEGALHRLRNVIAPYHAAAKKFSTPCVRTRKCSDCTADIRICNVITILEKRPWQTDTVVVLIDADLGLSWDDDWTSQRIDRIKANYEAMTWVFTKT